MDKLIRARSFSGRAFTEEDLGLIIEIADTYPNLTQTELASTVCELVGWVQANGKPKTVQCTQFLRILEEEGAISLPPISSAGRARGSVKRETDTNLSWVDTSELDVCGSICLEIVRPGEGLRRWRAYMAAYHRLGDPYVAGCQLRYLIKSDSGRDLGCMLFSAAAWSLRPRDEWIGWDTAARKAGLHLVANQSRFLIFPWVRVRNLASRALGMAARQIQRDWLDDYCFAPALMETFVESEFYAGTSYRAANWIHLGQTQGRGRNDRYTKRELARKAIFVYPLQRDFRAVLNGQKPCKAALPHV